MWLVSLEETGKRTDRHMDGEDRVTTQVEAETGVLLL